MGTPSWHNDKLKRSLAVTPGVSVLIMLGLALAWSSMLPVWVWPTLLVLSALVSFLTVATWHRLASGCSHDVPRIVRTYTVALTILLATMYSVCLVPVMLGV